MKKNSSALYSGYIIDGAKMDQTPARMLNECMTPGAEQYPDCCPGQTGDMIIDESTDPVPGSCRPDSLLIPEYMKQLSVLRTSFRRFKAGDPAFLTRLRIASAIIDSIWSEGHFRLDNLRLSLGWQWDGKAIGSMAAFYASAEAAAGYIYDLGATLEEYSYTEIQEEETEPAGNILNVSVTGTDSDRTGQAGTGIREEDEPDIPARDSEDIWLSDRRKCPDKAVDTARSILLYIPFDTCAHRLGSSLLEQITGTTGDISPEIRDPDYFIDCYEVVRELVEDGIIMSAETISDGGLLTAAYRLCRETGATIDVSGVISSYMENDIVKILFSEVPGALVQISENDSDYVDAQLLLQDIAYYPVGTPGRAGGKVEVVNGTRSGVAGILASLLNGQDFPEGED